MEAAARVGIGHFCAEFLAKNSQLSTVRKSNSSLLRNCQFVLICTQFWTQLRVKVP
jgi:hypothetical protein